MRRFYYLTFTLLFSFFSFTAFSQITSAQDGLWSNGSTWVGGIPPGASDDVDIQHNIQVSSNASCASITMNAGSPELLIDAGQTLSCGGNFTYSNFFVAVFSTTINGRLTVGGSYTMQSFFLNDIFTIASTGEVNVAGLFSFQAAGNSPVITLDGELSSLGSVSFTSSGNTFNMSLSSTGGAINSNSSVSFTSATNSTFNVDFEELSISSTGVTSFSAGAGQMNINQTDVASPSTFSNLTLNGSSGTLTWNSDINLDITNNLTLTTGSGNNNINWTNGSITTGGNVNINQTNSGSNTLTLDAFIITNNINLSATSNTGGLNNLIFGANNTVESAISGNITLTPPNNTSQAVNQISFGNCDLTIDGDIILANSTGSTSAANRIFLLEDNTTKDINLLGNFTPTLGNTSYENASEGSTNFNLIFAANGTQTWGTNAAVSLEDVTISSSSTTQFGGVLEDIEGTASVNGILDFNGFTPTFATPNGIHVNNDGILYNLGTTDHMNYTTGAVQFETLGLLVYETTAPDNVTILGDDGDYSIANVILQGSGEKTIGGNIDATSKVGHIDLQNGTLNFSGATALDLTAALSSIDNQSLVVAENTILTVNFSVPSFTGTLKPDTSSTVIYSSAASQNIFPANYYALAFTGGNKECTGDNIIVRDKLTPSAGVIDLNDTYITLFSDAGLDGFLGEITSGSFAYSGTGRFIIDKTVTVNTTNSSFLTNSEQFYRDFTIPIQEAKLGNFLNAGMPMFGISGGTSFTNGGSEQYPLVHSYNESLNTTESFNDFVDGSATSQDVSSALHAGWKIATGTPNSAAQYHFQDTGMVNEGDQIFNISFTTNVASSEAFRAANDGWHLVGNPYASTIDWSQVAADNSAILDGDLAATQEDLSTDGIFAKIWVQAPFDISNEIFGNNVNDYSEGSYLFYNPATGAGDANIALIPQYQAFWIKAFNSTNDNYSFTISESHKVDNQEQIRKSQKSNLEIFDIAVHNTQGDKVHELNFHEFKHSKPGYDPIFDIESFGRNNDLPVYLDFYAQHQALGLKVNAIGESNASNSFSFGSQGIGDFKISLTDLKDYAKKFDCATLTDLQTNESIDLNSDNVWYSFSTASEEPYLFSFNGTNEMAINTYSASCFGEADGGIIIDLKHLNQDFSFDIYQGFSLVASYDNSSKKIKRTLPPGDYTLLDKSGNLTCEENGSKAFSVAQPPMIEPDFTTELEIREDIPTTLINSSQFAVAYEWYFADDQTYSNEVNPEHTFTTPGDHLVSLTAFGENENCFEQTNRFVSVSSSTEISENSVNQLYSYSVADKEITLSSKLNGNFSVIAADGKVITSGYFIEGENKIPLPLPSGIYFLSIQATDYSETIKFVLQ